MKRIFTVLIFSLLCLSSSIAQESFHRLYPTETGDHFQVLDGVVDGNIYYILASIMPNIPAESEEIFLGKFDDKGNEVWSRRIMLEDAASILDFGGLHLAENDSLYFSIMANLDGESYRFIGTYDTDGTKGSTRRIGEGENERLFGNPFGIEGWNEQAVVHFSTIFNADSFGVLVGIHSLEDFGVIWSNTYFASDTLMNMINTVPVDLQFIPEDGTFLLGGNCLKDGSATPFVKKLDTLGEVLWSRNYKVMDSEFSLILHDIHALQDSTALLAGTDGGSGFIARIDTFGQVMWAQDVSLGDNSSVLIDHVTVNSEGMIVGSGTVSYTNNDSIYPIQIQLNGSGQMIWQNKYPRVRGFQTAGGQLIATEDGGTMYFTSNSEYDPLIVVPALIKTNAQGETTCEDTIPGNILSNLALISDTLVWEIIETELDIEETMTNDNVPLSLDIPVLSLEAAIFCPREPIDITFRATTPGAIAYIWDTGETSDTLRVMEEGMYSVTVTIDEKVCFTLCDTGQVTQYEFPEINIAVNTGPFCETGSIALQMNYMMGAPLADIEWSTGARESVILISEPGMYSVTVTDICDEVAMASINVQEFPELISGVSINLDDDFCANNGIRLTAVVEGGEPSSILWSNNTGGLSTVVTLPGQYTVTVRDICNNVFTSSIFVDAGLIKRISNVFIEVEGDVECILNEAMLTVSFDGEASSILWNTGSANATITVTQPGIYQVGVTDVCGRPVESSPFNLEECPECLVYPNVFFPRGQEDLNKTFGPTLECGDIITEYELKVYNRWGNLVFQSTNVDVEWNGMHNGNPAPSGVYVYFARYNVGIGEQIVKGDVTLLY